MRLKRIISVVTAVAMIATISTGTAFAGNGDGKDNGLHKGNGAVKKQYKEFKDMKGHWGYQSVMKMQEYGIFGGYDDDTFRPDQALTEAELAVLIERLVDYRLGKDADDDAADQIMQNLFYVSNNNGIGWGAGYNWGPWGGWGSWNNPFFYKVPGWAQKAVWRGVYYDYFNPNSFNPFLQCTRANAIVAIAKALGLKPVPVYTVNPFKDGKLIPDEQLGYILAMYLEGYISGNPDGSFNPNAVLTRAQMAVIIEKLLEKWSDSDDDGDREAPTWDKKSKVEAVKVRGTSVDLKWTGAQDNVKVVGYKVIYKVDGKKMEKSVTDRNVTIKGLEPGETYTFTVEARDAAGNWSDDGPSVKVTTNDDDDEEEGEDTEAPYWSNDSKLTATSVTADSVTLKWPAAKDNTGIAGYKVIYKVDGKEKEVSVTGRTVTIKGLEPGVEYTFTGEAKDKAGNWSDDGPSLDVTTLEEVKKDETAPVWPSGATLQVSPSASGIVTLIWPDAEDNVGVTAYRVYRDGQLILTLDEDANNCNVTGLEEDKEYVFKVRAVDKAGNMSSSLTKTYLY